MGLDMYLEREIYVGGMYEHRNVTGRISITSDGKPLKIKLKRVSSVIEQIGYWRKANAIHDWFVQNIQNGIDECQRSDVSIEQLEKLQSICKRVLANHDLAEKLLPSSSGFFFGGTGYDEYYYEDLKSTVKIIDDAIKTGTGYFIYQASW